MHFNRITNYTVDTAFLDFLVSAKHKSNFAHLFMLLEKKASMDFIAPSDKSDMVSYLPGNKIEKVLNAGIDPFSDEAGRSRIGVGRLFSKLFGADAIREFGIGPGDLEQFVNIYKSFFDMSDLIMQVVEGEDIRKWYLDDNYLGPGVGSLWKSCMRYKTKQPFLDMYTRNPDKVKMLVLLSGSGPDTRLRARALLWQDAITPSGTVIRFMDRIYSVYDSDVFQFKRWAAENGYITKAYQNSKTMDLFEVGEDFIQLGLSVSLPVHNLQYYPYMDTLRFYDIETGIIRNIEQTGQEIVLNSADGHLPDGTDHEEEENDEDMHLEFLDDDPF
jgi:hypothetical protein